MNNDLISLLIPIIVIILAIFTKRVIPSLLIGIIFGGIFLSKGNIIQGIILSIEHLVKAVANTESIYIIFFLFVFGAFGEIMKLSGGIKGFTNIADRYVKTEQGALWSIWLATPLTFIDCCFHGIATGTIGKALIDKVEGDKRKLALVSNVTSCLLIILIPFGTTYVGYIVGVIGSALKKSDIKASAYDLFLKSIPFNFYAIIMLIISMGIILFGLGFGKKTGGFVGKKQLDKSEHHEHEGHEKCEFEEKVPPRPFNLILPLLLIISSTFYFFWYTGKSKSNTFWGAFMNAEFEKAILISAVASLVLASIFYVIQRIPMSELESHFLIGGNEMIPPIIVLTLSWGLSSIVEDLGFTKFITEAVGNKVPANLIPVIIFLIGCVASYFMGSAWGTWALIMPIAIPLAVSANINLPIVIGAVLAGGSLGDNASPLGETAIVSATISDVPLMEHVKTQLPYSITGIIISAVLFVIFGLFQ